MAISKEMSERLSAAFEIKALEIEDQSEAHRGHAGFQEGGESHFHIRMVAVEMAGLSRIARHRAVHGALGADIMGRIHALSLDLS